MPSSSPNPILRLLQRVPVSSWVGTVVTVLVALTGALAGGFWAMLASATIVVFGTALYGWVFHRRTWLRLPRKRSAAAVGVGVAFAVFLGSTIAGAATHPTEPAAKPAHSLATHAPASPVIAPSSSPTPTTTAAPTPTRTATRTPAPTHTPVVTTELVAATSPVPFRSTSVRDSSLPQGINRVTTAGVNGILTTTYRVTLTDGRQTSRVEVSRKVTTAPVTQVTTIGTYVAPVAPGNGATALCNDGTYSYAAHHQGACSHHGGVAQFYK